MPKSRREFLTHTSLGLVGVALASCGKTQRSSETPATPKAGEPPAGAPPAFGTSAAVGPEVSPSTFAEGEKLVITELSAPERKVAADSWRVTMAPLYERRIGPRKGAIEPAVAPATIWDPVFPGQEPRPQRDRFLRTAVDTRLLPVHDQDSAFAPVTRLSRWIEKRQLTCDRLTRIYLDRLDRFNPTLRCVITLMRDSALAQARRADQEIAAGKYRGPLHGIPWGAKDLLDTPVTPTTYGAHPFRNLVPTAHSAVLRC